MKAFFSYVTTALCALDLLVGAAHAQATAEGNQETFDVEVNETPARAFFTGLVSGTRSNILVHPQVSGSITLRLRNVTIEQALEAAKQLYGYDYRHTPSGYMILPANVQTRIFQVSYLDIERAGASRISVSSGQLTQGGNERYGGNSSAQPTQSRGDSNQTVESERAGASVLTRQTVNFWESLEKTVRALIGEAPDRSVVVNAQSGVVAVRAGPNELRDVEEFLRKIEQAMTRQVVLEAKIIEVELSDAYQAGINWASVLSNGASHYAFGLSAPPTGFNGDPLTQPPAARTLTPGNPLTSLPAAALGGAFTLAADFTDFTSFIELLSLQGNARVLSSPRVSALNNQKAVIKAGSDEFFVTSVTSNTVTGTASSTSRNIEFTPFFSGVALDVTPQVSEDSQVTLHIHPSVSEVIDKTKAVTVGGETDTFPLAFSRIRESDSVVKARNGQVIVIGGLMRETRERQKYKMPILGSIPLLGYLFRSERDVKRTVELVILLRPLVVNDEDWAALAKEQAARVDDLAKRGKVEQKR